MASYIDTDVSTDSILPSRVTNLIAHADLVHCPVCGFILWKPVTCSSCENSFCLQCIQVWLFEQQEQIIEQLDVDNPSDYIARSWSLTRCPFNCSPYIERKCPPLLRTILSKLTIECQYRMHGCPEILFYEQLEKHEEICRYQIIRCPGCQQEMSKETFDKDEHQTTCLQIELQCNKCQSIVRRKDRHDRFDCMEKLIGDVRQQLMTFEQKCGEIQSVQRKKFDILDEKLLVIEQVWGTDRIEHNQSIGNTAHLDIVTTAGMFIFTLCVLLDTIRVLLFSF